MKKKTIHINHGPQFHGVLSSVGIIGIVISLYLAYLSHLSENDVNTALYITTTIICIGLFIDRRGLLIDLEAKRIKEYQNLWGWKRGKWESLKDFDLVVVTDESITSLSANSAISMSRRASKSYSYCVVLLSKNDDIVPFEVGEYGTHKAAKAMAKNLSNKLGYTLKDRYQEKLDSASERRNQYEQRRKRK